MKLKPITHREAEEYLSEEIDRWGWHPSVTREEKVKAKAALRVTLQRAREIQPRTSHIFIGLWDRTMHDCSGRYLKKMLRLRECLRRSSWNEACDELSGVLHCFHIEDGRILNEILATLEEFL